MSFRFEWNPNLERDINREVVGNLTPRFEAALRGVTCPEHGEHPTLAPQDVEEWQVRACCERAPEMGRVALAEVLR